MAVITNQQRTHKLLENAFVWLSEGVAVVPALPRSKAVNLHWREYEAIKPSEALIRRWFASGTNNLAVICGTGSLLVLDFDNRQLYDQWQQKAGSLARSYTEITGRGVHVFYKSDQPKSRRFRECEALGLGHLCLVAPSIHPSGSVYSSPDELAPILWATSAEIFSLLSEVPQSQQTPIQDKASQSEALPSDSDLISRIKAAFPLLDLATKLTELKPSGGGGRWFIGRCPLHEDEAPSFWVDGARGLWSCYSPSCIGHKGGDVINLYALINHLSTSEAIKRLAREVL